MATPEDILKDNVFLCDKSLRKTETLLQEYQNNPNDNKEIMVKFHKLLTRMGHNITEFLSKVDKFVKDSDDTVPRDEKIVSSPKKRLGLSLKRTSTQETNSEREVIKGALKRRLQNLLKSDDEASLNVSESENFSLSQTSVKIKCEPEFVENIDFNDDVFDQVCHEVPNANFSVDFDESIENDVDKSKSDTENSENEAENDKENAENETDKSGSDAENTENINKSESDKISVEKDDSAGKVDFLRNLDLQPLLDLAKTKIIKDTRYNLRKRKVYNNDRETSEESDSSLETSNTYTTDEEDDAELALKEIESIMRKEVESSDYDSEKMQDLKSIISESSSESEDSEEDNNEENESGKQLKVNIVPLDKLDDNEIDRLCNLNNLNKRKCLKSLEKRNACYKRPKIINSSSSLSCDDEFTSGSITPDLLDITDQPLFESPSKTPDKDSATHDLDMLLSEQSDDSEKEDATKPKKITKKKDSDVKENEENMSENEENAVENDAPKTSDWRNDPLLREKLWADSDDSKSDKESDNEDGKDALKKKRNAKRKWKLQGSRVNLVTDSEDSIISCSTDDDSDSDIEFISDTKMDNVQLSQGKGRRNIHAVLDDEKLTEETQRAKKEEDARILRLEQRARTIESVQSQHDDVILDVDPNTNKSLITINSYLSNKLKQHQIDGVKFMWNACYESVEMIGKNNSGSGCILAHCMGLGKTLQVITLIHTLFAFKDLTKFNRALIICPLSTVLNWKNEFKKAFKDIDYNFQIHYIVNEVIDGKYQLVKKWYESGGVLVMSYEQFTIMANEKNLSKLSVIRRTTFLEALINPGPDLIVCDEGHNIRNAKTLRSKALTKVKTKRRIVLTGTPLQNNLTEYYYMVQFVKPHLLGTYKEYSNRFTMPIENGQYDNSNDRDVKIMKQRTHVLNKLLKKTVHRIESSLLKEFLPELKDYAVFIKLHPKQIEIYEKFINYTKETPKNLTSKRNPGFFSDFNVMKHIAFHPFILLDKDLFKSTKSNAENVQNKKRQQDVIDLTTLDNNIDETPTVLPEKKEWFRTVVPVDAGNILEMGTKMVVLFDIIQEARKCNDKLLIFGYTLLELNCIEHFFKQKNIEKNRDYYRMDGKTKQIDREFLCKQFNSPGNTVSIFLMTVKVGGLGLNLVAANRVVLIGTHFNPCYDTQSIFRAYRFGQTKPTYVYRLLSMGTVEEKIYQKGVVKSAVATTVVDRHHVRRHFNANDVQYMYEFDFGYVALERPIPILPTDNVLAHLLRTNLNCFKYHEHQDLLENRPEEELSEEEKRLAWDEYNRTQVQTLATTPTVTNPAGNASNGNVSLPQRVNFYLNNVKVLASAQRNNQQPQATIPVVNNQIVSGSNGTFSIPQRPNLPAYNAMVRGLPYNNNGQQKTVNNNVQPQNGQQKVAHNYFQPQDLSIRNLLRHPLQNVRNTNNIRQPVNSGNMFPRRLLDNRENFVHNLLGNNDNLALNFNRNTTNSTVTGSNDNRNAFLDISDGHEPEFNYELNTFQ